MRKLLRGTVFAFLGLGITVVGLLALNVHTFNRLTDEAPIAKLRFTQLAPQIFSVELRSGDFCRPQTFRLYGDEWRVDARFLKWKPLANLFGLDAMYQLERLSGRYRDIRDENTQQHMAWEIGDRPAVDILRAAEKHWAFWSPVDTSYGSSVYERIDPDRVYTVYRAQSGLLVRSESAAPARYEGGALLIQIEKDCPE